MECRKSTLLIVAILLSSAHLVISEQQCDASDLDQCPPTESCVVEANPTTNSGNQHINGNCRCLKDYKRETETGDCIRDLGPGYDPLGADSTRASSVAAGVLVPLTLIAGVAALIYFGRRYEWLHKLRQSTVRNYDTVLIGAQIDGDDDPPIS